MQISSNRQLEAPPYSPTAAASEQGRLPHDYIAHPIHDRDDEEEDTDIDPLQSLRRVKTTASTISSHGHSSSNSRSSPPQSPSIPSPTSSVNTNPYTPLTHFITARPTFDMPPSYSACDTLASSFRLHGPLIYATKTSTTPRYQLLQEFSRRGEPRRLHIRRLMPTESRRCSLPTLPRTLTRRSTSDIPYDEEATMYTMTRFDNLWDKTSSYEMRGLRSSTLGGIVVVEKGKSVLGGRWVKIWQKTRNRRNDSLNPENEDRLNRYGYQPEEEWDKNCLFTVKGGKKRKGVGVWNWSDGEGRRAGVEEDGGLDGERRFEVLGVQDGWKKDLMVACWVMKVWMGGLRWEGDELGR
ncbi:hypothetical protein K491DRAFT_699099 [Lophiostoma macrostomum CBS 122681]|uniref:Uncharacterized protein n=1 Tax=Lophiostoma macrostomum CBS 122681 TaxID=1314788 RepID=A0A6A6SP96_9PLEO|nr:hypothetical protein K491DRAFT_699099 [Lophiostoma macrostomum CBS 122681]